jgi:NADPH:quinone reductase-like Zn-dependent oxidoreductase
LLSSRYQNWGLAFGYSFGGYAGLQANPIPHPRQFEGETKMYAYTYFKYGGPDVLNFVELPTPTPKANEVLIRVYATTVSAGDWRARSLTMPAGLGLIGRLVFGIIRPRKPILGTDLSGVVEAVGADITTFKPGDALIGFPGAGFGAHAEHIVMPADGKIVHKPAALSFHEAAAIPFGATTAYDFLINKGKLRAGERVLINGASDSTGSACVQIAKHFGAEVTGVCSGANADLVRVIGADHVIDYNAQDFTKGGPNMTWSLIPWKRLLGRGHGMP